MKKMNFIPIAIIPFIFTTACSISSNTSFEDWDNDGFKESDGDCDDNDSSINPARKEICDGIDQNCDGSIDENSFVTFYLDQDEDTYGSPDEYTKNSCEPAEGYVSNSLDCDDQNANTSPNKPESCDSVDNNCDGKIDEDLVELYYFDKDGDGFGDPAITIENNCGSDDDNDYVSNNLDCNDNNKDINPSAEEIYNNGIDENCTGSDATDSSFQQLSAGAGHILLLHDDASIIGWGTNQESELSNNPDSSLYTPTKLNNGKYSFIEAGKGNSSFGITADRHVYSWGYNVYGQLGLGYQSDSVETPTLIPNLSDVIDISEYYHTVAVKKDGTVWAWGYNRYLLDTSELYITTPVLIPTLSDIVDVSVGSDFSLARSSDGKVFSWGYNVNGELGYDLNGTTTPTQIPNLTDIVQIDTGIDHCLALKSDGTVLSWGSNVYAQLGYETQYDAYNDTPTLIEGLFDVKEIATGGYFSVALKNDGTVWGWGDNYYLQLGNLTAVSFYPMIEEPTHISEIANVKHIFAGESYVAAITEDNGIYIWGDNRFGQLGDGSARISTFSNTNLLDVNEVSLGMFYGLGVTNDGSVVGWGDNSYGRVGTSIYKTYYTPTTIIDKDDVKNVCASEYYSFALKGDGDFYYWGALMEEGNTDYATTDTPILFEDLHNIKEISSRFYFALLLDNTGNVYSVGDNYGSVLGNGSSEVGFFPYPSKIEALSDVKTISAGVHHSLVLKNDGTVWAWGSNSYGELGIDPETIEESAVPIQVAGLEEKNIIAIEAGYLRSMALTADGLVYVWGNNNKSYLGLEEELGLTIIKPTLNPYLSDIVSIKSWLHHSLALKNDGSIIGWGYAGYGALASGLNLDDDAITLPTVIEVNSAEENSKINKIMIGPTNSFIIDENQKIMSTGANQYNQLAIDKNYSKPNKVIINID